MKNKLNEIIRNSTFKIEEERFVYTKVKSISIHNHDHFMISRDKDEITVVTKEENLGSLDLIEKNREHYKLISLNVSVPFYSVGFLAAISTAIAKEEINILIVSTYSKDYILVQEEEMEQVTEILTSLGLKH